MKMLAPAVIASLNIANVEYRRGDDEMFDIPHDHVEAATTLGLVPFDPESPVEFAGTVLNFEPDHRDQEIADLRARLAAAEAAAAPRVPLVTADATEDTSSSAGGTTETRDKMAAALALNPKFDEMGRDDMVEWLKNVGVVIPANVSKESARKAVDEAVADYHSAQKD